MFTNNQNSVIAKNFNNLKLVLTSRMVFESFNKFLCLKLIYKNFSLAFNILAIILTYLSSTKEVSKYNFSLKIIKICTEALYCYVTIG